MHTNEERLAALYGRSAQRRQQQTKRLRLLQAAAAVVCFCVVAALVRSAAAGGGMRAGNGAFGFVAVGIVAFLLGVSVTVFCLRLRKWQAYRHREDRL